MKERRSPPNFSSISTDPARCLSIFQIANRIGPCNRATITAGARIENEISLSDRLGLSRPTIRRAIQELVEKGLIVRRRGVGTQVVQGRLTRKMALSGLYEDLSTITSIRRPSPSAYGEADEDVATRLGVDVGEKVLYLRRLRLSDGAPVALMENYIPREFDSITDAQLVDHCTSSCALQGATMKVARQTIGARHPNAPGAQAAFDMFPSDPVLTMDQDRVRAPGRRSGGPATRTADLYNIEMTLVDRPGRLRTTTVGGAEAFGTFNALANLSQPRM